MPYVAGAGRPLAAAARTPPGTPPAHARRSAPAAPAAGAVPLTQWSTGDSCAPRGPARAGTSSPRRRRCSRGRPASSVGRRVGDRRTAAQTRRRARRPAARPRQVAQKRVSARRSCRAPGRRTSRRAPAPRPARQQVEVPGHPLQGGVGDQDVDAGRRLPAWPSRAGPRPDSTRPVGSCPPRRAIISGLESRPTTRAPGHRGREQAVRLPGPQPRSTTSAGSVGADPGEQLHERPAALVGVGEVRGRGPRHASSPRSASTNRQS